jgi:DNA-binding transcriptional regulator YiaG
MNRKNTKAVKNVGERIIQGLSELRDVLRTGAPLEKRFTVRTVDVPDPEKFDARRVRLLRDQLQMSQHVFAKLLGVSTILAQSWEQGVREPSPLARRLLGEIERDPRRWQRMIVSTSVQASQARRKSA